MTSSGGHRMGWHSNGGQPPYPPYESYNRYEPPPPPHHQHQGPPPPPYHHQNHSGYGGPPPPGPPPPHEYWYDHQRPAYGPPPPGRDGPPPPGYYHGEGRQGPPPVHSRFPPPPDSRMRSPYGPPPPHAPPPPEFYGRSRERPEAMYPPPPSSSYRAPHHPERTIIPTASSSKEEEEEQQQQQQPEGKSPTNQEDTKKPEKKKDGDPLSLLAKVAMAPPKSRKAQQGSSKEVKLSVTATSPSKNGGENSPLQRRVRSSPIITPSSAQQHNQHHPPPPIPMIRDGPRDGPPPAVTPKPITPTGARYYNGPYDPEGRPSGPGYYGMPPPPPRYSGYDSRAGSWEQHPAVVEERNSFDSGDSGPRQHSDYARRYSPYPPPSEWESRRWQDQRYRYYYDEQRYHQPQHQQRPPYPPPYSYVQQPTLEEKTVLRKKFSWKHYPELERFLIENRDEYLKFSSRNYTVEQKQFNNMLTERLIALAEKNGYVFDPDDFNFVAIRDRIRCYYKSYVQTARKRGLMLPTDKKPSIPRRDIGAMKDDEEIDDAHDHQDESRREHSE